MNIIQKDSQGVEEDKVITELGKKCTRLTKCAYETIKEVVVPEKAWIKKNGRVVSKETKKLFEDREKEYAKNKPTQRRRRKWNKKIRNACRNDYRRWVSEWVQRIEEADNKGDTKAIYRGVKAVSGIGQGGTRTRPTMKTLQEVYPRGMKYTSRGLNPSHDFFGHTSWSAFHTSCRCRLRCIPLGLHFIPLGAHFHTSWVTPSIPLGVHVIPLG